MRLDHLLSKELLLLLSVTGLVAGCWWVRLLVSGLVWVLGVVSGAWCGLVVMPVPNVCRVVAHGWNIDEVVPLGCGCC